MPTIANPTITSYGTAHISRNGNVKTAYLVENIIDFAEVLTAKGSALVATDVVEALQIPSNTIVRSVGMRILTPANSTTLTMHLGTEIDVDEWVVSLDGKAVAGTNSPYLAATDFLAPMTAVNTIDITFATLTGTLTSGRVLVWAEMLDTSGKKASGLAKLGS